MSGNFNIVDEIADMTNGTVTIFLGDTRVATNVILEDGQRAVGTQVSQIPAVFFVRRNIMGLLDICGQYLSSGIYTYS
ncbi:cache domain-containing protein [Anaerobacillus sp. HL2]|nr:cache domain-containing protein [Anaerobacillus sp. HL2]